MKLVGINQ